MNQIKASIESRALVARAIAEGQGGVRGTIREWLPLDYMLHYPLWRGRECPRVQLRHEPPPDGQYWRAYCPRHAPHVMALDGPVPEPSPLFDVDMHPATWGERRGDDLWTTRLWLGQCPGCHAILWRFEGRFLEG